MCGCVLNCKYRELPLRCYNIRYVGAFCISNVLLRYSPNRLPSLGQIGAFYFEIMDQSQVWIDLEPQNSEPGPNPIKLNFTVAFHGHEIEHAPDMVEVRARSYNTAFPQITRRPMLGFRLEDGSEVDLAAPGKTFQIHVPRILRHRRKLFS